MFIVYLLIRLISGYFIGVCIMYGIIQYIYRRKCTGTLLTNGCGKTIYRFQFKFVMKNQFIVLKWMLNPRNKNINKLIDKVHKFPEKYITSGKKYKVENLITYSKSHCCLECWEIRHKPAEIAEKLTSGWDNIE